MTTKTAPNKGKKKAKKLTDAEIQAYLASQDPEVIRAALREEQFKDTCIKKFGLLLDFMVKNEMLTTEQREQVTYIKIEANGEITTNRIKRAKRQVSATGSDEGEDENYGIVLAEGLIAYQAATKSTQAAIAEKLTKKGRNGGPPSQATISNWLNGESTPSNRWHDRLSTFLQAEGYLTADEPENEADTDADTDANESENAGE